MQDISLEQVIRQYVSLPSVPSGGGWYPVVHKQCDHGKKGPRAGWKFDENVVAFHCFNCSCSTVYDPTSHHSIPKKMVQVLDDFGVPKEEWQQVVFANLANQNISDSTNQQKQQVNIEPIELPLPDCFYLLSEAKENDKWAEVARYYLTEERGIEPSNYPFMLSTKSSDPKLAKWFGRIIIPIYKDNKVIFYIGRDLVGNKQKKYESPPVSKEKVLYGFDKLFQNFDVPLYIVEGWFDAFVIDGVAILGNELSKSHIAWLNRSPRKKVYIPDRFGDGKRVAEQALKEGWHISTPDIGDCKDMNEAVNKYGKLYVMKSIVDNTAIGFAAETKLGVYCK